jgi:hypothetical protein
MQGRWTAALTTGFLGACGPRTDLLADYDYVKSGQAQMVIAMSFKEYGKGEDRQCHLHQP